MDKAKNPEDAFNIILGTNDQGVFLALFNWNSEELGIYLSNIPTDKLEVVNRDEQLTFKAEKQSIHIQLKPRTSVIFKLISRYVKTISLRDHAAQKPAKTGYKQTRTLV